MASIENIDLSQEIESWKSAVYGKDVRAANVAAFEKIQGTVNDTVQNVNQAAEDSASAAHNAQAAVDSIQAAIVTATEKAAAAATSATQAAGSQEAADSSKTAAAQSATDAITAKTAAEAARDATEHIAGFDGTAASVKATDTYGLVVDALGESTTQDLIDAVANKVINELIAKSNIVNNLLATEVGTVLSGALGPIIDQRLTDLMNKYTQLNGDLITGIDKFPPANTGIQEITVNFPAPMKGTPKVFATWKDNANAFTYVDGLVIAEASSSGFKIATNRLKASENWWFCYVAICNR